MAGDGMHITQIMSSLKMPSEDVDSYIHRIGRTGRIGNLGMAVTLVTPRDVDSLALIDRKIKANFKPKKIDSGKNKPNSSTETKSGNKDRKSDRRKDKKLEESKVKNLNDIPKKYRPNKSKERSKTNPNDNRHRFKKK